MKRERRMAASPSAQRQKGLGLSSFLQSQIGAELGLGSQPAIGEDLHAHHVQPPNAQRPSAAAAAATTAVEAEPGTADGSDQPASGPPVDMFASITSVPTVGASIDSSHGGGAEAASLSTPNPNLNPPRSRAASPRGFSASTPVLPKPTFTTNGAQGSAGGAAGPPGLPPRSASEMPLGGRRKHRPSPLHADRGGFQAGGGDAASAESPLTTGGKATKKKKKKKRVFPPSPMKQARMQRNAAKKLAQPRQPGPSFDSRPEVRCTALWLWRWLWLWLWLWLW